MEDVDLDSSFVGIKKDDIVYKEWKTKKEAKFSPIIQKHERVINIGPMSMRKETNTNRKCHEFLDYYKLSFFL